MIARLWKGWTTLENADAYERLLREQVLPGLQNIKTSETLIPRGNDSVAPRSFGAQERTSGSASS